MRIVVIGGTGHVGSYLVPRLFEAGHDVTVVSRRQRAPYHPHGAWTRVAHIELDRAVEEAAGRFGENIAALRPDVVVDLICYTLDSAVQLCDALRGRVQHLLHCGTIWVHGPSAQVPTTEEEPRRPFGEYGCRKAAIERYLLDQARSHGLPATVLHPGHLVGPGWAPINPAGNLNTQVFSDLAAGREVLLPNLGMETVHHVHADDVAQGFARAVARRSTTVGESFHVVSPGALTLRGYAERMAAWFGCDPVLRLIPWEEWKQNVSDRDAAVTLDHISRSPHCSIAKARTLLGYEPRYSSIEAVRESVAWLVQNGTIAASASGSPSGRH
jgi:nucleoside-diphosphate-sugar epimerase